MANNKGMEKRPFLNTVVLIVAAILLLFTIIGEMVFPREHFRVSKESVLYTGDFYWVKDGECTQIECPSKQNVGEDEVFVVETILPKNITIGETFCVNTSHASVRFYIKNLHRLGDDSQGTLIHTYDTTDNPFSGNHSSSCYIMVPMNSTYAGKVLRMEFTCKSVYRGILNEVFYNNENTIWQYLLRERLLSFAVAVIIMILGMVVVVGCMIMKRVVYRKMLSMTYLGYCSFAVGIWILTESRYRQLLFSNFSVIAWMAYLVVYLYPATKLLYFNEIQNRRYKVFYRFAVAFLFITQITCTILHLTKKADFVQTMFWAYGACAFIAFSIAFTLIQDVRKNFLKDYSVTVVGFAIEGAFVAAEFYADAVLRMKNVGFLIGIGNVIFVILASYNTALVLLRAEERQRLAVAEGEAKSVFLANMSHEIRTPLNAILGMNQMILRDSSENTVRDYAKNIDTSGELLLSIINDILDFSKISSGKMDIVPTEYELSKLIHSLDITLRPKAKQKELKFIIDVDATAPEYMVGDELRIRQVAINFINNAIKYTDEGEVKVTFGGNYVTDDTFELTISVYDTGKGIKEEDKNKLFSAFGRVDLANNRSIEGTGLGLSIANSLVNLMEGRISVNSEYGVGSTFAFAVPQKLAKHERIGSYSDRIKTEEKEKPKYVATITAPEARVLIVDDTKTNLTVAKLLLRETKVKVTLADSGQKALNLIAENDYDIMFLDHMMPEMDGVETLNRIKADYPDKHFPVLALTANAVSGSKEKYLSLGFDDYISKPVTTESMEGMLLKWLPENLIER